MKKVNRKEKAVLIKFSEKEYQTIKKKAERFGLSFSAFIRFTALSYGSEGREGNKKG